MMEHHFYDCSFLRYLRLIDKLCLGLINYLIKNGILENSLNSDNSKTQKRAKLLVEQNIYGLN